MQITPNHNKKKYLGKIPLKTYIPNTDKCKYITIFPKQIPDEFWKRMNQCKNVFTPQYFFGMLWQYNGPLKKDHSGNFVCIQYQPNVHCTIVGFDKISSDNKNWK